MAVLPEADVLLNRAEWPQAVLLLPVVLPKSAKAPLAVFRLPSALLTRASSPRNVFPNVKSQPSRQSACALGESAKQARASGMSSKASGQAKWFMECFNGRVVVFICARFCLFCSPRGNDKVIPVVVFGQ